MDCGSSSSVGEDLTERPTPSPSPSSKYTYRHGVVPELHNARPCVSVLLTFAFIFIFFMFIFTLFNP